MDASFLTVSSNRSPSSIISSFLPSAPTDLYNSVAKSMKTFLSYPSSVKSSSLGKKIIPNPNSYSSPSSGNENINNKFLSSSQTKFIGESPTNEYTTSTRASSYPSQDGSTSSARLSPSAGSEISTPSTKSSSSSSSSSSSPSSSPNYTPMMKDNGKILLPQNLAEFWKLKEKMRKMIEQLSSDISESDIASVYDEEDEYPLRSEHPDQQTNQEIAELSQKATMVKLMKMSKALNKETSDSNQGLDYLTQGLSPSSQGLDASSQGLDSSSQGLDSFSQGLNDSDEGLYHYQDFNPSSNPYQSSESLGSTVAPPLPSQPSGNLYHNFEPSGSTVWPSIPSQPSSNLHHNSEPSGSLFPVPLPSQPSLNL
jgi:hypothetical protein